MVRQVKQFLLPGLVFEVVLCTERVVLAAKALAINQPQRVAGFDLRVLGSSKLLVGGKPAGYVIRKATIKAAVCAVKNVDIVIFTLLHTTASSLPAGSFLPHR